MHVWGAMHAGGKSQLVVLEENVNGVRYRDILQHHMPLPSKMTMPHLIERESLQTFSKRSVFR